MLMKKRLNNLLKKSKNVFIGDNSKIVIMSDCHRGSGDNYDNFSKNRNLFQAALKYYYKNDFTYIELGDGDDMWEVKNYEDIIKEHIVSFKLLKKFNDLKRFFMINGNHDICKKSPKILKKYFYKYQKENLLNNLNVYESIILNYYNHKIFLIHGHQIDFFNSNLWRFSRFLVRYVWRSLEHIGFKDPTNAVKNYPVKNKIEKRFQKWSRENNIIVITGHTHRPIFPKIGNGLYFNDGSCIHPNGISCIEIENGIIRLIKWSYQLNDKSVIYVKRDLLEKGEKLINYFKV